MNPNGSSYQAPKKPKIETIDEEEEEERSNNGNREQNDDEEQTTRKEQEEAFVALIEHRTKEVEHLRNRISYYKTQVFCLLLSFSPFSVIFA